MRDPHLDGSGDDAVSGPLDGATEGIELVVFDVGGTTIRDGGQVASAFASTLDAQGIAITAEELRPWRGASKRRALRHFLETRGLVSSERLDEVYLAFTDQLKAEFARRGVQPVPGAGETFAWLRSLGVRVALTTGFDREVVDLLFGAVGWDGRRIDAIVCGEEVPQGRPAPDLIFHAMERTGVLSVRRVVNLGDTVLDLQSGWNAGVLGNIGVLSGAHTLEQLQGAPHTHLLPSVAALPSLFASEGGRVRLTA